MDKDTTVPPFRSRRENRLTDIADRDTAVESSELHHANTLFRRAAPTIIGITVAAVFLALYRPFPVGVAQDDGLYMILAKALATGQGYRFINLPGAPAGVHYPPGYPVLLAAVSKLAEGIPGNPWVFAAANAGFLGIGAAFLFVLARRTGMGAPLSCVCALAGFLMAPALWMNTALLSEPMWLGLAIPWLVWADAAERREELDARTALMLGATAGCIALVRSQAATLALALVVVLALRRRWKPAALVMLAAVVVVAPWQLWVARHSSDIPAALSAKYGPYTSWLIDGLRSGGPRLVVATVTHNVASSLAILQAMFVPIGGAALAVALLGVPGIAAAWRLARRNPVVFTAIVAHAAIIVALPFEPQRYIWTSWPLVVFWLCAGAAELWELTQSPTVGQSSRARLAVAANLGVLALAGAGTTAFMLSTGAYRTIARGQQQRIEPTLAWVRQHTAANTVVASDDETAVFLYTGRQAVPATSSRAADYQRGDGLTASPLAVVVTSYRPDIAIVSWKGSIDAAMRMSNGSHPSLRQIDQTASGVIFERVRSASERPYAR